MQKIILIIFLTFPLTIFSQTNSFVTEYYLANNFTPKPGITPGSDNTLFMDCDQILARYQVTISGITSTGHRLPSQNQLTSSFSCSYPTALSRGSMSTSTTNTLSIPYPSTINANDVLLCIIAIKQNTTFTIPSGWDIRNSSINSNNTFKVILLSRTASGSESGSITTTLGTSAQSAGIIFRYSNTQELGINPAVQTFTSSTCSTQSPYLYSNGAIANCNLGLAYCIIGSVQNISFSGSGWYKQWETNNTGAGGWSIIALQYNGDGNEISSVTYCWGTSDVSGIITGHLVDI